MAARYGRTLGWTILATAVVALAAYLVLLAVTDVRPPLVAVDGDVELPDVRRGDAVLVEQAPDTLNVGTLMVARYRGDIVIGRLAQTASQDGEPVHLLEGTGRGEGPVLSVPVDDVVGISRRRIAYLGWPLMMASEPLGQLALLIAFGLIAVALFLSERKPARPPASPEANPMSRKPAADPVRPTTSPAWVPSTGDRPPWPRPPRPPPPRPPPPRPRLVLRPPRPPPPRPRLILRPPLLLRLPRRRLPARHPRSPRRTPHGPTVVRR